MELPNINFNEVEWLGLNNDEKLAKISEVLNYLRMIEDGDHPLYRKHNQGKIGLERRSLEKFIEGVMMWEATVKN